MFITGTIEEGPESSGHSSYICLQDETGHDPEAPGPSGDRHSPMADM